MESIIEIKSSESIISDHRVPSDFSGTKRLEWTGSDSAVTQLSCFQLWKLVTNLVQMTRRIMFRFFYHIPVTEQRKMYKDGNRVYELALAVFEFDTVHRSNIVSMYYSQALSREDLDMQRT